MRIKPEGRKAVWPVLGERAGFVQDGGVAHKSPLVCVRTPSAVTEEIVSHRYVRSTALYDAVKAKGPFPGLFQ